MKLIVTVGMPGSGKDELVEIARQIGLATLKMGDLVRDETRRRGLQLTNAHVGRIASEERDKHGAGISMTWIRLKGRHRRIVCHESDRVYYILAGTADFRLGDGPGQKTVAGDSVFIPRGTPYDFNGEIDYLVMNGPAFLPDSDVYLD